MTVRKQAPEARPREFSAGVVVVRRAAGEWRYLLLRAFRNWDFPKGRVEPGEQPLQAAVRETMEESALDDLMFPWGTEYRETAPYSGGKVARYYLALSPAAQVSLPVSAELGRPEHDEFRWVSAARAPSLLPERLLPILDWAVATVEQPSAPEPRGEAATGLDAALGYLALGWSVIPVQPREKRPLVPWLEFQQRAATERELREWWTRWPDANVAVVTGAVSGLVVLDVDAKHGGLESLASLQRENGELPETLEAITGSGGRHLYFAHPGGVVHNRVGIEPGIDLRGDGGYVVAPPSLHPSGARYRWAEGRERGTLQAADLPRWLLARVRAAEGRAGHPLAHWRGLVKNGVGEGKRNSTLASLAGHLLWHGIDPAVALDLLLCWNALRCRPPLPEDELARVVESITRLHQRGEESGGP